MDSEKLKQFLLPIFLIILIIAGIVLLTPRIIEQYQAYTGVQAEIQNKQSIVSTKERDLAEYSAKEQAEKVQEQESQASGKPFYKPIVEGMDTEAVLAGEFAEILELVRANQIKVRSIKFDPDPKDDNFVQGAPSQYQVARLNMEMIANYVNYDNFLKEVYKHDHFLDIQSAEIVPYKKNKKILLINFKLKLYSKK